MSSLISVRFEQISKWESSLLTFILLTWTIIIFHRHKQMTLTYRNAIKYSQIRKNRWSSNNSKGPISFIWPTLNLLYCHPCHHSFVRQIEDIFWRTSYFISLSTTQVVLLLLQLSVKHHLYLIIDTSIPKELFQHQNFRFNLANHWNISPDEYKIHEEFYIEHNKWFMSK